MTGAAFLPLRSSLFGTLCLRCLDYPSWPFLVKSMKMSFCLPQTSQHPYFLSSNSNLQVLAQKFSYLKKNQTICSIIVSWRWQRVTYMLFIYRYTFNIAAYWAGIIFNIITKHSTIKTLNFKPVLSRKVIYLLQTKKASWLLFNYIINSNINFPFPHWLLFFPILKFYLWYTRIIFNIIKDDLTQLHQHHFLLIALHLWISYS